MKLTEASKNPRGSTVNLNFKCDCIYAYVYTPIAASIHETCETDPKLVAKLVVKYSETCETHKDQERGAVVTYHNPYEFHKFRCVLQQVSQQVSDQFHKFRCHET